MTIIVKLFASLGRYLPAGAKDSAAQVDVPEGASPAAVLLQLGVPAAEAHLLLINGAYVEPTRRGGMALRDGDIMALWPPVGGG